MRHACCGGPDESSDPPAVGAYGPVDILAFAATPVFAMMALVCGIAAADPAAILCSGGQTAWLIGMAPMYALMGIFHAGPWLRLVARQNATREASAAR